MSALLEDIFDVKEIDKDGKRFQMVSRMFCESESFKMGLIIDVHSAYRLLKGDKFRLVVSHQLTNYQPAGGASAGTAATNRALPDDEYEDQLTAENELLLASGSDQQQSRPMNSKLAEFDYVCFGKIYRIEVQEGGVEATRLACYVSFGGLLMQLTGDASNMQGFRVGNSVYVMIKKLAF